MEAEGRNLPRSLPGSRWSWEEGPAPGSRFSAPQGPSWELTIGFSAVATRSPLCTERLVETAFFKLTWNSGRKSLHVFLFPEGREGVWKGKNARGGRRETGISCHKGRRNSSGNDFGLHGIHKLLPCTHPSFLPLAPGCPSQDLVVPKLDLVALEGFPNLRIP